MPERNGLMTFQAGLSKFIVGIAVVVAGGVFTGWATATVTLSKLEARVEAFSRELDRHRNDHEKHENGDAKRRRIREELEPLEKKIDAFIEQHRTTEARLDERLDHIERSVSR